MAACGGPLVGTSKKKMLDLAICLLNLATVFLDLAKARLFFKTVTQVGV
jgi:hypothetical protein